MKRKPIGFLFAFFICFSFCFFLFFSGDSLVFGQICQNNDGVCFTNCTSTEDNDCGHSDSLTLTEPIIFGQPSGTENVPNQVVGNRVFHPGGVLIDRGTTPNRVYVWDSGNSRILAFSSLGVCQGGVNKDKPCTNNLDCPQSSCRINSHKKADLIIGQPDEHHASCNGDNTRVMPASAESLCGQIHPFTISLMESPEPTSMAVDANHNLYIFDKFNNRVLKFNDPFATDTKADQVWGQANFSDRGLNRGKDPVGLPGAREGKVANNTLHSGYLGGQDKGSGLTIDAQGNLWVADVGNNRVLRFPYDPTIGEPRQEADLVLGQQNFNTRSSLACVHNYEKQIKLPIKEGKREGGFPWYIYPPKNALCRPKTVSYNPHTGQIFVIDWPGGEELFRILIYNPPFTNGMKASEVLHGDWHDLYEYKLRRPLGLEIDPNVADAFWVQDTDNNRILYFRKRDGSWWSSTKVLSQTNLISTGCGGFSCSDPKVPSWMCQVCGSGGSLGLDSAGNIYVSALNSQQILIFSPPIPKVSELNGKAYTAQAVFLQAQTNVKSNTPNYVSAYGMRDPGGAMIVDYPNGEKQLLVLDQQRLLFWNDYDLLPSGSPADGVLFQSDFYSQQIKGNPPVALEKDSLGRIWVGKGAKIYVFQGPLQNNQSPEYIIPRTLPLRFGGTITTSWVVGLAYDEKNNALWIGDRDNHRVVRLACPLNEGCQRQVDLVLGQENLNNFPGYNFQGANRNQDDPFKLRCANMVADGFGFITSLELDRFGNLYIVDAVHEGWACSNNRVVEYDREDLIPHPQKNFFKQGERIPKRVYGGSGFEATDKNRYRGPDNPFTPISISFTNDNQMLLTADGYGNPYLKRVFWYDNPLPDCETPCRVVPSRILPLPVAQPRESSWDKDGNVVLLDHTWNRVLLFGICRDNDGVCPSGCGQNNDNDCFPQGDLDKNGQVDGADVKVLLLKHGIVDSKADLNFDNIVNGIDIGKMYDILKPE